MIPFGALKREAWPMSMLIRGKKRIKQGFARRNIMVG